MPISNWLFVHTLSNWLLVHTLFRYIYSPHSMYARRRFGNKRDFL